MNTNVHLLRLLLPLLVALSAAGCGDDSRRPPPSGDSGVGDGGDGAMPDSTMPDAPMDAGDLCVGVDCSAMDDACNSGVCNPATGACMKEPVADGTSCDDADPCTTSAMCSGGTCAGEGTPDCTAMDDMCNVGMCDSMSGDCMAAPVADGTACDDGDACTLMDSCGGGACVGVDGCGGALYAEDFEAGDGGWTTGGTNSSWEYGMPAGSVITQAASGANAWVTNLDGNYNNSEDSYIESPPLDFSGATSDPFLRFSHDFLTESCCDEGWVEISIDGGTTFTKLGASGTGVNWYNDATNQWWDGSSDGWRIAQQVLTGTAGQADVRIRFVFSSDTSVSREGFGVDDVLVLPDVDGDLAIESVTPPAPQCGSTTGPLTVRIRNLGTTDVTGFDVTRTVGSMAPETETSTDTIAAGDFLDFTSADVSVTAEEPVTVRVTATADPISVNDARSTTISVIPQVTGLTYEEDFEADDGGYHASGTNSTWAYGTPNGGYIRAAASGTGAWVTNLSGAYANDEESNLDTVCLDLTGASSDPVVQFHHAYETESCCDEGWVEISVDDGATWTKLTGGAAAINWYNDTSNEWWDGSSAAGAGAWELAQAELTGAAGNVARLRFRLSSDGSSTRDGFGVDDLRVVTDVDGDLAIEQVMPIAAGCATTTGDVVARIRNMGSSDVTGFDIQYVVGAGTPVMETATDTVPAGGTLDYTFSTPASSSSSADVTVTVAAVGDPNAGNDVGSAQLEAPLTTMAFAGGYAEDFEADDGGWVARGANASWAWGAPSGTYVSAAAGGTNAWVTNLSGDYNASELSYLATGFCLDLSGESADPTLSFSQIYDTESCCDEGWVEMSTDGGATWTKVGSSASGTNWYNDTSNEWWDGTSGGAGAWRTASHELTGAAGEMVQLRFVMSSDGSVQHEGFGVDDISIM